MKATADASASGLIHPVHADPRRTPVLRWRWKVENLLAKADVTSKQGDDYPARIYVAFAYDPSRASLGQRIKYAAARLIYGEYPPHSGLNYIWESKAPVGTVVPNPFIDRVRMIVVDSGPAHIGQWVEHERNVYEDYKQAFGEEPPMISGIAIMTDADNTRGICHGVLRRDNIVSLYPLNGTKLLRVAAQANLAAAAVKLSELAKRPEPQHGG